MLSSPDRTGNFNPLNFLVLPSNAATTPLCRAKLPLRVCAHDASAALHAYCYTAALLPRSLFVFCNPTTSPATTSRLCSHDLLFIPVMSSTSFSRMPNLPNHGCCKPKSIQSCLTELTFNMCVYVISILLLMNAAKVCTFNIFNRFLIIKFTFKHLK